MNALSSEMIERLGWVLVHSVWQFAVVAIVAGMLVAVLRRRTATSRYAVLVTAMLLIVAVPCATWMMIPQPAAFEISDLKSQIEHTDTMETVPPLENSINEVTLMSPNTAIAPPIYEEGDQTRRADAVPLAKSLAELLRPWFSWIVGGWLIGVLLCSLRPLLGWRMLRRLRRIGISPPSDDVLAAFTRVSQQLGLRRAVKVFHSTLATGPLVVGYLKPVVLLPVSLVSSIPLPQLEAILAHELAHIRRHDFIINLAQTLMETLFFYHPAIWWLSRRIRIEREHCCDDLVVKLFNNGVDYGRALLAIEQLQSQRTVLALGAADGSLLGRIRRILGHREPRMRSSLMMSAVATICFVMVFYGLIAATVFSKSDEPQIATVEISAIAVTALISDQLLAEIRHMDKSQTNSEIAKNILVLKGNEIRRLLNSRKDDEDAFIGAGVAVLRSTDGFRSGLTQSVAATNILRINEQQVQMTAVGSVTYKLTAKDQGVNVQTKLRASLNVATNPGPEFIVDDAYQLAFGESMVFVVEGQAESQWRGAFVVMYEPVETSKATPILSLELDDWLEHGPGTLTRLAQESEAEKEWLENPKYDTSFADDAWTKTLSKNGKIQLLALSLPGKGSGFWWSPQGAPVANARGFSKMNSNSLGSVGVRVWEPGFDRCFLNGGEGRSIGNQADFEDHFSETEQSQLAILGFEAAELNTSKRLRLGAGFGEWSPFAEIPFESNAATIVNGANLQLWPIYDAQDNMATHAWAIITCPAQEKVNLDFTAVAITKDGRELPNVCNPTVYCARPDGTTQLIFDAPAAEIKSLAIKSRPIYWVTFEGFSLKPAKKTEVNVSVESPLNTYESIQADLPTGLRVQLAGVTTPIILTEDLVKKGVSGAFAPLPTADKPDTRQWWSGDGLKLDMAPEPGRSWMVRKEWEDGRQFAFETSGLPDSDSELNVVMFHDRATEPQQAVMIEVSKSQLDPGKRIVLGSIAPNAEAVSATLELRIGTGKSATVKFDTDGKRIDSLADDAALHSNSMKQIIANIKFLRIVQNGENVEVWTRPITTNGKLGSVRYSVLDKTGKSHSSPGGYSMNDEQLTPFKNLSVANIREVHFEIRAFDHYVMFENVSLKPGNKSDVRVTVASLPEEKTPVAAASESKDPKPVAIDAADAAQVAHFTGVVKDDKGQPLAGARIYILPFASGKKDPGPVRATTDKNGLFEFDAMDMTYPKYDGTLALYDGLLIATKEGYGPDSFHTWGNRNDGLRDWTTPVKGAKIDLQLAKDDVPVRGRLLDPEGKPLVRANVNVEAIGLPIKFNLDTHLKAEAEADIGRGFLTGAKVYERSLGRPELVPDLITQLQTDADGRFEITGVGHERLVTLSVRHSSIQDARIEVMSRVAPDVGTIRDFEGKATSTLHGSGFTRQMSPGLTLTGIVRDRRSKAPISGMWVTIFGDPVKYAYDNRNPAVTDANGRFTITGLNPVYATQAIEKRDIAAYPQPGIPYLMAKAFFTSNEETIIECEPGIPFRLKVVDEIGRPVEGGVFYRPITPNPMIEELVKPLRGNSFDGVSMRALRRDDGTYEGFVLPGPGAIVFDATQRYVFRPALVDPKAFFEPLRMDWPANSETIYGTGDTLATIFQSNDPQTRHEAIVLVNPPDDSKPLELTATVLKDRPRQVSLIDPEGKPVAGVDSRMRWPDRETNEALNSATFMLRGLHPDRVKQMTFFHKERNLTGILLARGDSDEPMTVILQPSAVVTGRLSFQDGKPRNNFYLAMRATDEGVDVLRLGELGRDGIFRIVGLIPGLSFSSVNSGNVLRFVSLEGKPVENLILMPGEVRDVGEVRVVPAEPTNAGGVPE